jgi:hypothetical protein
MINFEVIIVQGSPKTPKNAMKVQKLRAIISIQKGSSSTIHPIQLIIIFTNLK